MIRAILDTNVIVSAMRSDRGTAFKVLSLVGSDRFEVSVSVALVFEYESALSRWTSASAEEIARLLDYLCSVADRQKIFYLWRPYLRDPMDDHVLEVAVASRSQVIVTFNKRDFGGCERFGIRIVDPREFLLEIGE